MTTIAYRGGIMAADTQVVCGGIRQGHTRKIVHQNGWLVGGAGIMGCITPVLQWIEAGHNLREPVKFDEKLDSFGILMVDPDQQIYFVNQTNRLVSEITAEYAAEGSGYEIALTAMACGRDARKAIKVAMELDVNTGGRVTWLGHDGKGDLVLP